MFTVKTHHIQRVLLKMSEDKVYKDADIVWVKLGNSWWPGEVTGINRQPEGLIQQFKKKPYCVVKFFQEDTFEYVKTFKQIFPFECQKKSEFIRKGLALFNAKNKFMEKFPADVEIAENLSKKLAETKTADTGSLIMSCHADNMDKSIACETTVHERNNDNYDDTQIERSGNNFRRNSITYLNITSNRRTSINTLTSCGNEVTAKTTTTTSANKQFKNCETITTSPKTPGTSSINTVISRTAAYNPNMYQCNLCNFTSTRQNVMIFHRKIHSNTTPTSTITANAATTTTTTTALRGTTSIATTTNRNVKGKERFINTPESKMKIHDDKIRTIRTKIGEVHSTTAALNENAADVNKLKENAKRIAMVDIPKSRVTRSRRTTHTTTTSEDGNLTNDRDYDDSSIQTDDTAVSTLGLRKKNSNPLKKATRTTKNLNATTRTRTVSKANSEELRQRLLADWSDGDNGEAVEHILDNENVPIKKKDDKVQAITDDGNANNSKMASQQTTVTDDNCKVQSLTRIRNIPKKDRRDVVITEFKSEATTKLAVERRDSENSNAECVDLSKSNNKSTDDKDFGKMSCFDFCEDDDNNDEENTQQNTLKSIANYKKKLLINTNMKNANKNEAERSEKFIQLSTEIENLLEQSNATISDVDALQRLNSGSKEDLTTTAVKDLPIKERGKRIFKSRNRTHSKQEQFDMDEQEKLKDDDSTEKKLVFENKANGGLTDKSEYEESKMIEIEEIESVVKEPIELFLSITPTNLSSTTDEVASVEKVEEEDESSTISEADAEFGSSTSMLDDDRLPLIKCKELAEQQIVTSTKDTIPLHTNIVDSKLQTEDDNVNEDVYDIIDDDDDDDEEIESPPHEELSGNELEEENARINSKQSILKLRTPTPKKNLLKKQQRRQRSKTPHSDSLRTHKIKSADTMTEDRNLQTNTRQMSKSPNFDSQNSQTSQNMEESFEIRGGTSSLSSTTKLYRKRRGHMKITPCRTTLEKLTASKENAAIDKSEESEELDVSPIKRHKSEDSNSVKDYDVLLKCTKIPTKKKERSETHKDTKTADNVDTTETLKRNEIVLQNNKAVQKNVDKTLKDVDNTENVQIIGRKQSASVKINEKDKDDLPLLIEEGIEQKITVEKSKTDDIKEQKTNNNDKLLNKNIKSQTLSMKRKHEESVNASTASKVVRTNGGGHDGTLLTPNKINHNISKDKNKNLKSNLYSTKMKSLAAAATGGRKQAGNTITLPNTGKLKNNNNNECEIKVKASISECKRPKGTTQQKQMDELSNTSKVTKIDNVKLYKNDTPPVEDVHKDAVVDEIENTEDSQQAQTLRTFSVDDGQVLEMQSEEPLEESSSKILAVPTHPIPGYNETFLLCTVVNNQYKPIDDVPLYLDHDLNQLVPVPVEALEGQPILIVNQPQAEEKSSICAMSHSIKTVLPSVAAAAASAEEETQMLCLPTQVTDIMAEAAAATVSTIMTPALMRGNESSLQFPAPMHSALQAAASAETLLLVPDEEDLASGELVPESAIIVNVDGQQIILEGQTLVQLLANPEANTQLVTDDGTEFVMTRELLAALGAQQQALLQRHVLASPSAQDILAVALAESDLYGNDMLDIEGSQLVCTDGTLNFQTGVHLTPPITAQTSETNTLLDQTPIMSTLEAPTSTSLSAVSVAAAANLKSHNFSPSTAADLVVAANSVGITTPNLEDSLAVIGVTTQPSAIPTSLELPITVTNPAIAPKVSLTTVLPVSDAIMQFALQPTVGILGESTHM